MLVDVRPLLAFAGMYVWQPPIEFYEALKFVAPLSDAPGLTAVPAPTSPFSIRHGEP